MNIIRNEGKSPFRAERRHSQAVRQRSAKPSSPVRFRVAPPKQKALRKKCFFVLDVLRMKRTWHCMPRHSRIRFAYPAVERVELARKRQGVDIFAQRAKFRVSCAFCHHSPFIGLGSAHQRCSGIRFGTPPELRGGRTSGWRLQCVLTKKMPTEKPEIFSGFLRFSPFFGTLRAKCGFS